MSDLPKSQGRLFAGESARATRTDTAAFPFWASLQHLWLNLLASGFPENSNREIRRPFDFAQGKLSANSGSLAKVCPERIGNPHFCQKTAEMGHPQLVLVF